MKILSDFDGVLTDPSGEAADLLARFRDKTRLSEGLSDAEWDALVLKAEELVAARPEEHGWEFNGRISAFANEDGFLFVNALARILNLHFGHASAPALAAEAFSEIHPAHRKVDTVAVHALIHAARTGHDVVLVSNSKTDRIMDFLKPFSLPPNFRIRGDSRKFELGNLPDPIRPRPIQIGPYSVQTDRPRYEAILREERPDVVIGDVFSLDLALPFALSAALPNPPKRLFLRFQPYTPSWSERYVRENSQTGPLRLMTAFTDLIDFLNLAATR